MMRKVVNMVLELWSRGQVLVGIRFRHYALSSDGFTRYREELLLHYLD